MEFGVFEGTTSESYAVGRKALVEMDFVAFSEKSGWNGSTGWRLSSENGLSDFAGAELRQMELSSDVNPLIAVKRRNGIEAIELGEKLQFGGRMCQSLKVANADLTFFH